MLITRIKVAAKQATVIALSMVLISVYPAAALAEEAATDPAVTTDTTQTTPVDTTTTPPTDPVVTPAPAPAPPPPGPVTPNGADANTYHFNPANGCYENDFYIWNPVTRQTTPKNTPTYSYNPATGMWDTTKWLFDAPSGKYIPNIVEVSAPPAGALLASPHSVDNSGPDSNVNGTNSNNFNGTFNNFYNAQISNSLYSMAHSGDASVMFNTLGGNATSGNALSQATVINMLQSQAGVLQGNGPASFVLNIGDHTGDIVLDLAQLGPGSNVNANNQTNADLTLNTQQTGNITNDINLNAVSGNATVSGNTTGGNATSGDALVMAHIVNIINSVVGAGKSFVGTVNINGNLDGDILLPQATLNALIAASGPTVAIDMSQLNNANVNANLTNNQSISNNVNANAASGGANVSHNTTGGNATSGEAQNKSNIMNVLNLTGNTVIGKDCILVFVNVMGNWVGMIVNAPGGSTAAALGGDLTTNTTNNLNADLNAVNNQSITNNINLNAQSGDANVTGNTKGGNATSGDATTVLDIANTENASLNLTDWLGILFINVFGSWNGSFGVNTSAGDHAVAGGKGGGTTNSTSETPHAFKFVSTSNGGYKLAPIASSTIDPLTGAPKAVKSAAVNKFAVKSSAPQAASANGFSMFMVILGLLGFAWILATTEIVRRYVKQVGTPALNSLQAAGSRLLTFLF